MFVFGVLLAVIGLIVSIALHEVGHLVPAKLFGVRVTQYMVGFGPTLWSKVKGETEYGVKAIPLGGYVSMIGMFPPAKPGEPDREGGTGFVAQMVQDARTASSDTIPQGQDHRAFYRLPVWKRVIIMLGGPLMNVIIGLLCFSIVIMGIGASTPTTTVNQLTSCAQTQDQTCIDEAAGAASGLKPGDTITAINGEPINDWATLRTIIRDHPATPLNLTVNRDGSTLTVALTPNAVERQQEDPETGAGITDANGDPVMESVGYAGIMPTSERVRGSFGEVLETTGQTIGGIANVIATFPQRVVTMFQAGFLGAQRDPNGPMSVVGVSVVQGDVAANSAIAPIDRAAVMVQILGSLNIALAIFNLVPLPPLDGGHIASALWDGLRNLVARIRRKPRPAPFDSAKLIPLTMAVSVMLLVVGALFIFTDIVNPIRIFQ